MLELDVFFQGKGAQRRVAEYFFKKGVRVSDEGSLFAGDIEVKHSSIARILDVDRRVIVSTIKTILSDDGLKDIYSRLAVTPSLTDVGPILGYGVIEIIPSDASEKGIVSAVSRIISEENIGIRQVIVDDPMFDNPEMIVVTEKPIPRELIDKLLVANGVKKIVVLN